MDEDYAVGPDGRPSVGEAPSPADFIEVEYGGERYEIPAALQEILLSGEELDRRRSLLDEHARDLDARARKFASDSELSERRFSDRAQLHALDVQLSAYEGVDWRMLAAEDPRRAEVLWRQFEQTQAVRAEYAQALAEAEDGERLEAERSRAAQFTEAGQVLSREIDGWSPEIASKLVEYAGAFGVTVDELREVADHRLWRILHRAYSGDEQSKRQAASQAAERAQAVRPAVMVAGAAAGTGGVRDELATKEWMRRRNAQTASG